MNRCYISFFPFLGQTGCLEQQTGCFEQQTGCLEQQTGCFEQVHKRHPSYVFLLCKQPGYNELPIPCFYRKGLGARQDNMGLSIQDPNSQRECIPSFMKSPSFEIQLFKISKIYKEIYGRLDIKSHYPHISL